MRALRAAANWSDPGMRLALFVAAGFGMVAVAVVASVVVTGTFVIDSAPAPGLPEQPSPYFHFAAGITVLTLLLASLSAALLVARSLAATRSRRHA